MTAPEVIPLAHSGRDGAAAQTYPDHILSVAESAKRFATEVSRYFRLPADRSRFVDTVQTAAVFHDIGKLCVENQGALHSGDGTRLPVNHVDAGVAYLLDPNLVDIPAALLVYAHHIGLPSLLRELEEKKNNYFRDMHLIERTRQELPEYVSEHRKHIPIEAPVSSRQSVEGGLWRRMALSCLVDADHSDTARHFDGVVQPASLPLRPGDRLAWLDDYVARLGRNGGGKRANVRHKIYQACRDADVEPSIRACDSPVGSGKTTAVMAHLLSVAKTRGLRRVFVVLPFTNIIDQCVSVLRDAIALPGESADEAVVPHHHRAEFADVSLRHLAARWDAPIVVTTAVQFFETLAGHRPASVRKLHQIAGSAVFIDEAHAALPAHLWKQAWLWIRELADDWGCHFVLASGSLARFWTLPEFSDPPMNVPDLVSENLRREAAEFETSRVRYETRPEPLDLEKLVSMVFEFPGPRLMVLNTVQSAAVVAEAVSRKSGRERIEHLSTALAPRDREPVIKRVKLRLSDKSDTEWIFVATSCVEAGLDLSFRTAFRESCGLVNLIQLGGKKLNGLLDILFGTRNDQPVIAGRNADLKFLLSEPQPFVEASIK